MWKGYLGNNQGGVQFKTIIAEINSLNAIYDN